MHSTVQKPSESKPQSKAKTSPSEDKKQDNTLTIEDQRPETAMQFKLMEGAGKSSRVNQLGTYQRKADNRTSPAQRQINTGSAAKLGGILQRKEDSNGLPSGLRAGVESLSGQSMNDVTVHRNSDKPAQLQAHAYAQGTDIHLGPGQEQHLPHEAWHVAQQKQGRVEPTTQLKAATLINDDKGLEQEADVMGAKAMQAGGQEGAPLQAKNWDNTSSPSNPTIQRKQLEIGKGQIQGFGTTIKNFFGKTTFTKLTEEVKTYNGLESDEVKQGEQGEKVKALANKWRDEHQDSQDPNDRLKLKAVNQILVDLKSDTFEVGEIGGAFKNKEEAENLDITKTSIDKKKKEEREKGFVDETGKISDKKGWIMNTSFMSHAQSTSQGIVEKVETYLGTINANEKAIRSDAAVHTYFAKEREGAIEAKDREAVTKHAESVYNWGFIGNVLSEGTYPATGILDKLRGKTETTKDELDATKLKGYQSTSFQGAKEIHDLNNSADDDLATLISYATLIQSLSVEEEKESEANKEESVQSIRKEVLDLIEDSKVFELKVENQKNKSSRIVQPLYNDGRMAGFFAKGWDAIQTATVTKTAQMVTMGLVSAEAKYTTGGITSSEGFDLQQDDTSGELKEDVVKMGGQGESRFNFKGPATFLKDLGGNITKLDGKAGKFKTQPIKGLFLFSGALKEFEGGIAYIKQIVGTVQNWAALIGAAFPLSLPVTGAIAGVCQVINNILGLIVNASKTARMMMNAMVKIMNNDPELWGLVSQNFAQSATDMGSMAISEGAQAGYAAGQGQDLENDATGGVTKSLKETIETDPSKIAAEAAKTKTLKESGFSAGSSAVEMGGDQAELIASEKVIGNRTKEEKGGKPRPKIATKAFESAKTKALPIAQSILGNTIDLNTKISASDISAPQKLTSAIDQETTKLSTNGAQGEALSKKTEEANIKKQEAQVASEVGTGIENVGEKVIQKGSVMKRVAEIEKVLQEAKDRDEVRAKQLGSSKKTL